MPYSRYTNRRIFLNNDQGYKNTFFDKRDIQETFQYDSPRIVYPTPSEIRSFNNITRLWNATDTLYNLSSEFYGAPNYWWVIAWYNKKASEAEFKVGDIYLIPLPLEDVLGYIE